jgi:DNA polymerase V
MTYIAIDLKSFYASVECVERDLDPLKTNLVVADSTRTEKTICLAVSPALKGIGIPGRPRLFEVVQKVEEENRRRLALSGGKPFTGISVNSDELEESSGLELGYIAASPRMALYLDYSRRIKDIYLKYVAPEDMHVYSVDEVFLDVTPYLNTYKMTAHELAMTMIQDVLKATGITATAGIGTNLYLCKIAMDIVAKKMPADSDGVRIAELDETSYRRLLWNHRPLTDFWRVGRGYERKLRANGLYTMGDIARCSLGTPNDYYNEELLYRLFGINAELLIDHAWGYEPVRISDIKSYKPQRNSLGSGQVLTCPYTAEKARLIVKEMTDLLVLDLVGKSLVTDQVVLTLGYDTESLSDAEAMSGYSGKISTDRYGRRVPYHAHGTENLPKPTSSTRLIMEAVLKLYDRIVEPKLLIRRVNIVASHVIPESEACFEDDYEQLDLFTDYSLLEKNREAEKNEELRERSIQNAIIDIQKKYGKNALLKGMNLEEGAMTITRNGQIGGHKA